MAEYHFLTIWRIEAPLDEVYAAIEDSLHWPNWWPSVRKVEQTAPGNVNGINNIRRYSWQGKLPYRVVFDIRATRIDLTVASVPPRAERGRPLGQGKAGRGAPKPAGARAGGS